MKLTVRLLTSWLLPLIEVFCVGFIVCFLYIHFSVLSADLEVAMPSKMQISTGQGCGEFLCLDLLSEEEKIQYDLCYNRTTSFKMKKFGPIISGKCRFQDGRTRYPVALGSFQGSGNTWLRGLLEEVTGICTGSLYCDGALRTKGFSGEGVHGPSVLAIKSHSTNPLFTSMEKLPIIIPSTIPIFGAAIVLVRNPRNAMIAEWHRERSKKKSNLTVSNHFLYVGKEYFRLNPDWSKYIVRMMDRWKHHVCGWLLNGRSNPLHVVKFEDLKENTLAEMLKIIDFYGGTKLPLLSITSIIHSGYNQFYRNHTDAFSHFTVGQERYISEAILNTMNTLKEHYSEKSYIMSILQSYVTA